MTIYRMISVALSAMAVARISVAAKLVTDPLQSSAVAFIVAVVLALIIWLFDVLKHRSRRTQ